MGLDFKQKNDPVRCVLAGHSGGTWRMGLWVMFWWQYHTTELGNVGGRAGSVAG